MHSIHKFAVEIVLVLVGTCLGFVQMAIRDFKAYRKKRRESLRSKLG